MCKFLLDSGANVNAKGGESVATPAMWAAQRCHYYIVNLLLSYGADPLLTDVQGYNILHLATIDGNAFLLVLLLHQEIPVDVVDQQGHTGLMWAAYKGYPACVDLFLRWGANANAVDEGGLTPLHWALVKGSLPSVLKLLEYGADRFAKTRDGKSPFTVAQEMNTLRIWNRALAERGYEPDGTQKPVPMGLTNIVRNKSLMAKFFFLWPFLTILIAIWMLSNLPVFLGVPVTLATLFGMQWIAQQIANRGPAEYRILQKTVRLYTSTNLCCLWHPGKADIFCFYSPILPAFSLEPCSGSASAMSFKCCLVCLALKSLKLEEHECLIEPSNLLVSPYFEHFLRCLLFSDRLLLCHGHDWRSRICAKDQQQKPAEGSGETVI